MRLPPNVVQTSSLEWASPSFAKRPPFAGRLKSFTGCLPRVELGFHLQDLEPGYRSCPVHDHLFEEEHFYVLEGTLTVTERTPDGKRREFELHAGELIAYPAGTRLAHGFANRGSVTAVFLAFSDLVQGDICTYPDSGKTALRGLAVGAWLADEGSMPTASVTGSSAAVLAAARERRLREPVQRLTDEERPAHVAPADLPEDRLGTHGASGRGAALSRAAGARALFAHRQRLTPGAAPLPLYRHRFNEEVLFVLEGRIALHQDGPEGAIDSELSVGDLAHFPPRAGARQLSNAGDGDAIVLRFGTDRPYDVVEIGRERALYAAAFGEHGRLESLDYFAGECEELSRSE